MSNRDSERLPVWDGSYQDSPPITPPKRMFSRMYTNFFTPTKF